MQILQTDNTGQPTRIEIIRPDNWHGHVRDHDEMRSIVAFSAAQYDRMTIMPNTGPIRTVDEMVAYRRRIINALHEQGFDHARATRFPQMTLYLDGETMPQMVAAAKRAGVVGFKFYPKNEKHGTTGAGSGVPTLFHLQPGVLETMEKLEMHLLLHGESVNCPDILDLERFFVDEQLQTIVADYPGLHVCLEHVTTKEGIWFVEEAGPLVTGTITPQHMRFNINDLFAGGLRPLRYCLPVYKHEPDRANIVRAATSGNPKFCAGDDTAPHPWQGVSGKAKLSDCGCAGAFVAPISLSWYTEAFAKEGSLDERFEAFLSINGAKARGLPVNNRTLVLEKKSWKVPTSYPYGPRHRVAPVCPGEQAEWQILA